MSWRSLALVGLVGTLLACSDAFDDLASDPCAPGHSRRGDTACTLPSTEILIDGKDSDWNQVPLLRLEQTCGGEPCPTAVPSRLQLAVAGDGAQLVVRVLTGGALIQHDPKTQYVLELTDLPAYNVPIRDQLRAGGGKSTYVRNGFTLQGKTHHFSWLVDGFELAINFKFLTFISGASIKAYLVQGKSTLPSSPVVTLACWREEDRKWDSCRSVDP